jgi:hypothetical protein
VGSVCGLARMRAWESRRCPGGAAQRFRPVGLWARSYDRISAGLGRCEGDDFDPERTDLNHRQSALRFPIRNWDLGRLVDALHGRPQARVRIILGTQYFSNAWLRNLRMCGRGIPATYITASGDPQVHLFSGTVSDNSGKAKLSRFNLRQKPIPY